MNKFKHYCIACMVWLCIAGHSYADVLPNIHIIATGGTIAGAGQSATASAYKPGELKIDAILQAVPQLNEIAHITSEQIFTIASQDMTDQEWLQLAQRVNELLADDRIDGIVITHGTDTMEETAYFLQLTGKSSKPVVLTGAMRPATSLSADGPMNLYNAVQVAADKQSTGKGVLVVLNNTILGGRDATKTHTTQVETFQSPNSGILGTIHGQTVTYLLEAAKQPSLRPAFDITGRDTLPKVGILYGHANEGPEAALALIEAGYDGIVHAGVGNGNIHKRVLPVLSDAARKGIAVVRSSRITKGASTPDAEVDDKALGFVAGEDLNPQKARILLMLALMSTQDREQIQKYFDTY